MAKVYLPSAASSGSALKPRALGVLGEHPVDVAGPQAGLLAARAALDLDDHVLVVVGVALDHREADLLLEPLALGARGVELLAHVLALVEQLLEALLVVACAAPLGGQLRRGAPAAGTRGRPPRHGGGRRAPRGRPSGAPARRGAARSVRRVLRSRRSESTCPPRWTSFRTIIEPFRIHSVEPIRITTRGGARGRAGRGGPQPVRPARRGRAHRPADRLGDRGDELRAVGGHPARRRELRGLAVVVPLPRRGAGAVRLRPRDPDPPGPRGGEDPLQRRRRRRAR